MACKCNQFPDAFYLDEGPRNFLAGMRQLDVADWMRLYECSSCGSLWAVDEWDKYTHQVVNRVVEREGWNKLDTTPRRKGLLLASLGGVTDEKCIWAGCAGKRVKGV